MLYMRIDPTTLRQAGWKMGFDDGKPMWHKDGVGIKTRCPYNLTVNFFAEQELIKELGLRELPHVLERLP